MATTFTEHSCNTLDAMADGIVFNEIMAAVYVHIILCWIYILLYINYPHRERSHFGLYIGTIQENVRKIKSCNVIRHIITHL